MVAAASVDCHRLELRCCGRAEEVRIAFGVRRLLAARAQHRRLDWQLEGIVKFQTGCFRARIVAAVKSGWKWKILGRPKVD